MSDDMTITEFCDYHDACQPGREWALANCATMAEVWAKAKPEWLLWVATQRGVLPDRELRLFAVFCARQVQHLMTDSRSLAALDVAERHANGQASDEELGAARVAAYAAACDAARVAAYASDAAYDAARAAYAATLVAEADRLAAACDAKAAWLRENTKPNFTRSAAT